MSLFLFNVVHFFIMHRYIYNHCFLIVTEYYQKGEVISKDHDPMQEFKNLPSNTIIVRVKHGSKIRNIMGFVEKSFKVRCELLALTIFMLLGNDP